MALLPSTACCEIASPAPRGTRMHSRHACANCSCLIRGGARCLADAARACGLCRHRGAIWPKVAAKRAEAAKTHRPRPAIPTQLSICIRQLYALALRCCALIWRCGSGARRRSAPCDAFARRRGRAYHEANSIRPPPATPALVGHECFSTSCMCGFVLCARARERMGAIPCSKYIAFSLPNSSFCREKCGIHSRSDRIRPLQRTHASNI